MAPKYVIFKETSEQDLAIEDGDFQLLEDFDAVEQQLGTTLRLSKKDWFLDLDEGLRWIDNKRGILGGNDLSSENEAEIIQRINNTFGIIQITNFLAQFITPEDLKIESRVISEFSTTPIETSITV